MPSSGGAHTVPAFKLYKSTKFVSCEALPTAPNVCAMHALKSNCIREAFCVDDLVHRRPAQADPSHAWVARDLPCVHARPPETLYVVPAVVEMPHVLVRDVHVLRLVPFHDAQDGMMLRSIPTPGHQRRIDLDALAAPPLPRPPSRAAPMSRQKLPTRAEAFHHLGTLLAPMTADVASSHDAHVAFMAKGFGEAPANLRQRQRASRIGRVVDVAVDLVGRARGLRHPLLARQGAVHVEGAQAGLVGADGGDVRASG
eukprot:CAMPEP_0198493776 /NCGR_PEP_ID=MMETSP1462-20131121/4225_1 /TAXON_ID=1333877 /ORGANISM="Brandtodinium nutriculum, Strain RCC3387" /LENGTH=255 /DNA_ID=CAMNT_0044222489 /DNA_START=151 /DNA_END=916 /DNA_ORIENTATION=+